jgi:hypothetical protein
MVKPLISNEKTAIPPAATGRNIPTSRGAVNALKY